MSKTIVHIGQMKSGTTYVQEILSRNRDRLHEQGILYPGGWLNQQPATYGICGSSIPWITSGEPHKKKAEKLKEEIAQARAKNFDILISAEALSSCDDNGIEEFLTFIGGADKAIMSVRNLHKTLPSAWQQTLKTGSYTSLADFFEQMNEMRVNNSGRWRTYAYGECAKRWAKHVNVESYILSNSFMEKTSPWKMFCQLADIKEDEKFDLPDKEQNSSFSIESALLLRAVSKLAEERGVDRYKVAVWFFDNFVFGAKFVGNKIKSPTRYKSLVSRWALEERDLLQRYSLKNYGDWNELTDIQNDWYDDLKLSEDSYLALQHAEQILNFFNKNK